MIREREVYGLGFMLNQPCHTFMPSLPGNDEPDDDDDDVHYYIRWRLKLEGETENTGVCTMMCITIFARALEIENPIWHRYELASERCGRI